MHKSEVHILQYYTLLGAEYHGFFPSAVEPSKRILNDHYIVDIFVYLVPSRPS